MPSSSKSSLIITIGIVLLFCPVVFPAIAWVAAGYMPRKYTSTVIIEVKADNNRIMIENPADNDPNFVANQMVIMRSREVLTPVIDQLGLVQKWSAGSPAPLSRDAAFQKLSRMLRQVKEIRNTDMLEISVSSTDPQEAADLANAIAVSYQKRRIEDQNAYLNQNQAELSDEVEKQRKKVDDAAAEVSRIRIKENIIDTNPDSMGTPAAPANPDYESAKKNYIEEKKILDLAEQRLATEKMQQKIYTRPAVIWERAEPARVPSSPNIPFLLLFAAGFGVLFALPGGVLIFIGLYLKRTETAPSPR